MKSALIASLVLLLSAGAGCRRFVDNAEGNALADRPARRVSGKVTTKAGPWRKAWVEIAIESSTTAGGRGNPFGRPIWKVEQWLVLDGASGQKAVRLVEGAFGEAGAEDVKRADAAFTLRFATDGHAIAVSDSGGAWRLAVLDLPEGPLYCPHLELGPPPGDPFAKAPTSAALLADVIAGGPLAHAGRQPTAQERAIILRRMCNQPTDAVVHQGFARAGTASDASFNFRHLEESACVRKGARAQPGVTAIYVAAIGGAAKPCGRGWRNAVFALGASDAADAQAGLTEAILRLSASRTTRQPADQDCEEVAADALARITAARGKAEPDVEARLVRWVGSGTGDIDADNYLVRAAAALSSPAVRAALTTRARDCADGVPEAWLADPDAFAAEMSRRTILPGCVARGALERSPGTDSADRSTPAR